MPRPLAPSPDPTVAIRPEDPGASGVEALLRAGEAAMAALYPAESNHMLSLDALRGPGALLLVARDGAGRALGAAALVVAAREGEIKRMWVDPQARGRGLGEALLAGVEAQARARGVATLRLETGVASQAALRLYAQAGYQRRPPAARCFERPPMSQLLPPAAAPVVLLVLSNVFMTVAWYGHLKFKTSPLWMAVVASWAIAFVEYCFAVPANRWGAAVYSTAQLKTMQEVITLIVFAGFSAFVLREPLTLNHAAGFALIALGAWFVFKGPF